MREEKADGDGRRFAQRLRRLRTVRGMKQAHLAELAGVDQATVSRWERGSLVPDIERRHALFRLLGAQGTGPADRALLRLVRDATDPVHLVCDDTHRLLAASRAREAEWGRDQSELLGRTLWPFATDEIACAEGRLSDMGWGDRTWAVRLWTGDGGGRGLPIAPAMMMWELVALSDGGWARLCTNLPQAGREPGIHRA